LSGMETNPMLLIQSTTFSASATQISGS